MKSTSIFVTLAILAVGGSTSTAFASDAVAGKKIAKKCKVCHTLNEGGKHRLGPNLYGILNNEAGKFEDYKYSKALKDSGIVWDDRNFLKFVTKPKKLIKRTKMSFKGIKKSSQRADLLAYFKTLEKEGGDAVAALVGDAVAGKRAAGKVCAVCHSFDKGGKVVYGPNLFDIYGKPAAAIKGYKYSKALAASGLTWDDKNIAGFVSDPENFVKGTTARFPGIKSEKDKADILAYIKTLK